MDESPFLHAMTEGVGLRRHRIMGPLVSQTRFLKRDWLGVGLPGDEGAEPPVLPCRLRRPTVGRKGSRHVHQDRARLS